MANDGWQELDQPAGTTGGASGLRNLWHSLLEKWWLLIACIAIAWALAFVYLTRAPTLYAATAVLKFDAPAPRVLSGDDLINEGRSDEERREKRKEIQVLLKSPGLLSRVIENNGLNNEPRFTGAGTNRVETAALVGKLARSFTTELRSGTTFMDVTVEHADAAMAAQLANALVRELIRLNFETHKAASQQATEFLAEEARELQRKLAEYETRLQGYRDQSLTFEQRQTMLAESLKELNRKLNESRAERIRLEAEYTPVRTQEHSTTALISVPRIGADPSVMALRAGVSQQEVDFANLRQVYKPKHPAYVQAQSKLQESQAALSNAVANAVRALRVSVQNATDQERSLLAEVERQEKLAQQLNAQFVPYNTLLRDIEQYRALYDSTVKRMGEAAMAGNYDPRTIQVFQPAKQPRTPSKPQRLFVLAASLAAGLGVGLLLTFGSDWMNDSFRTINDAESHLRLPVLSSVPRLPPMRLTRRPIVMASNAPYSGAESFRALRTSLFLQDPQGQHRSFLFTSSLAGEGKTFCAVNYAVSLAQQGYKTLLVDCDLRRPMLEKLLLGGKKGVAGVIEHLRGEPITIQETMIGNLYVIPAGAPAANSAEVLARSGIKDLMEFCLRQFDRVVVDSAPICGVSDTLRLVQDVQVVCLVVMAERTPRTITTRCHQMLTRAGAPLAGVVLNGVPRSRRTAYDNPYHDYGYYATVPKGKAARKTAAVPSAVVNFAPPTPQTKKRSA